MRAKGLRHQNDVSPCRICHAISRKRRVRQMDFHTATLENLQHLVRSLPVALFRWNEESARRFLFPLLYRLKPHLIKVPLQRHPMLRRERENRTRRRQFIIHDVSQPPPAARPRFRKIGAESVFIQPAPIPFKRSVRLENRCRNFNACRLRQNPHHVMPIRHCAKPAVPPRIVDCT